MADNEKAIGYVTQSALHTPGTVSAPMYGIRSFDNPPQVTSDSQAYLTNQAFNQATIRYQRTEGRYRIEGDVSPANLLPLLESGGGPAASGVVKFGVGVRKFLTLRFNEGLGQHWVVPDCSVNTLEIVYTTDNGWQFTAELVGPATGDPVASAWATIAPIPTDLTPFSAWQVVIKHGATFECVRRARVYLQNNMSALWCSPSADPTAGMLAGLTPTRYTYGNGSVAVELEVLYTTDAGSVYYAFRHQTVETGWTLEGTDPNATADVLLEILRLGYTEARIDRSGSVPYAVCSGFALLDSTAGTPVQVTVAA